MEPSVAFDGLGGGIRFAPIAGKDKRPPHQQFAVLPEAAFYCSMGLPTEPMR